MDGRVGSYTYRKNIGKRKKNQKGKYKRSQITADEQVDREEKLKDQH